MIAELIKIIVNAAIEKEAVSLPNPLHLELPASASTSEVGPAHRIRCRVDGTITSIVKIRIHRGPLAHSEEVNVEDIEQGYSK